jgi:hypothetical protein
VVLAALSNNLLPLARPGVPAGSVATVAMVVAMIFCIVLLIAITAAHVYGVLFLAAPDPGTAAGRAYFAAAPFYMQPLFWGIAAVAVVLAVLIGRRARRR